MKKKILIVILVLIILLSGIFYFVLTHDTATTNNNTENTNNTEENFIGVGGDEVREDFYNWETELNQKMLDLFAEEFPESYDFGLEDGEVFRVTLSQLEKKYGKDISDFNTDTIKCDTKKSVITVEIDSEYGLLRGAQVFCTNSEEEK